MPKTSVSSEPRSFLVQMYFVLAALIGLILIVISGVNVSRIAFNSLLGVKDYPEFSAPYPVKDPGLVTSDTKDLTDEQKAKIAQWEKEFDQWQEKQKEFNSADQNRRRQLAESLAMFIIGLPVFLVHMPYVWRKR